MSGGLTPNFRPGPNPHVEARSPAIVSLERLTVRPDGGVYTEIQLRMLRESLEVMASEHPDFEGRARLLPHEEQLIDPSGRLLEAGFGVYALVFQWSDRLSVRSERVNQWLTAGIAEREVEGLLNNPPILAAFKKTNPPPGAPPFAIVIRDFDQRIFADIAPDAMIAWMLGDPSELIRARTELCERGQVQGSYLGPMHGEIDREELRRKIESGTHTLIAGQPPKGRVSSAPLFKNRNVELESLILRAARKALLRLGVLMPTDENSPDPRCVYEIDGLFYEKARVFGTTIGADVVAPLMRKRGIGDSHMANRVAYFWDHEFGTRLLMKLLEAADSAEKGISCIEIWPIDRSHFLARSGDNYIGATIAADRSLVISRGFLDALLRDEESEIILAATLIGVFAAESTSRGDIIRAVIQLVDPDGYLEVLLKTLADNDTQLSPTDVRELQEHADRLVGERFAANRLLVAELMATELGLEALPRFSTLVPHSPVQLDRGGAYVQMGDTPYRSMSFNLALIERVSAYVLGNDISATGTLSNDLKAQSARSGHGLPAYPLCISLDGEVITGLSERDVEAAAVRRRVPVPQLIEVLEVLSDALLVSQGWTSSYLGMEGLPELTRARFLSMVCEYFDRSGRRAPLNVAAIIRELNEMSINPYQVSGIIDFRTASLYDKFALVNAILLRRMDKSEFFLS